MTPDEPFQLPSPIGTVLESVHQLLFCIDLNDDRILYFSPAYEIIWEVAASPDLRPSTWLQTIHPDDKKQVEDFFEKLTGKREQLECRIITATKNIKWTRIVASLPIHEDGPKNIITGTIEDISSEQTYRATTQHFTDRKNTLLQLLSHDLLGPLGNIQLSAKMIADAQSTDLAEINGMLEIIQKNCTRSVNLIQNLVNDEFLTTSKTDLIKQRVEMADKIRVIIKEFAESPNVTTQKFEFICQEQKLYINIDEAKFTQVIINLLSNALKFTPEHGNIQLILEEKENFMHITVKDDGIGIPEEMQPFLFDKFTRARRPGLRGEPTIGLGLSIIKRIVEWHEGTITVESKEGKGTTFDISIPILGIPTNY